MNNQIDRALEGNFFGADENAPVTEMGKMKS